MTGDRDALLAANAVARDELSAAVEAEARSEHGSLARLAAAAALDGERRASVEDRLAAAERRIEAIEEAGHALGAEVAERLRQRAAALERAARPGTIAQRVEAVERQCAALMASGARLADRLDAIEVRAAAIAGVVDDAHGASSHREERDAARAELGETRRALAASRDAHSRAIAQRDALRDAAIDFRSAAMDELREWRLEHEHDAGANPGLDAASAHRQSVAPRLDAAIEAGR